MTQTTDLRVDVDFEVEWRREDGAIIIHRTVWETPISGRGIEHSKMECTSRQQWEVGNARAAFTLAQDILSTLVLTRPGDHQRRELDDPSQD